MDMKSIKSAFTGKFTLKKNLCVDGGGGGGGLAPKKIGNQFSLADMLPSFHDHSMASLSH